MGRKKLFTQKDLTFILRTLFAKETNIDSKVLFSSNEKELSPTYSLTNFTFDNVTRLAKFEIIQSQKYRTIERYVTQNYVKHPIYSWWKTRTKTIKKSIKLTNSVLESLPNHSDEMIRLFADRIVASLQDVELLPSWFLKKWIVNQHNQAISILDKNTKEFISFKKNEIFKFNNKIKELNLEIQNVNTLMFPCIETNNTLQQKLSQIEKSKKSIVKSIFTCFIYNYLISEKRKNKIIENKVLIENEIKGYRDKISLMQKEIAELNNKIDITNNEIKEQEQELLRKTETLCLEKNKKLSLIQKLPATFQENTKTDFQPLKSFGGLEYKKIIGCYIIRNAENEKCYVGQSKDVYKRIKQHFHGTVPKNVIFAEDYYLSTGENKEKLFEIKIIPCETKDELDKLERELIVEYDALNNGYNGTSGNN